MSNTDFSYRLERARSGSLRVSRYLNDDHTAAEIFNSESGSTYAVTLSSCTCSDFVKHQAPTRSFFGFLDRRPAESYLCKHIMFLMLQVGLYAQLCPEVCGDRHPSRDNAFIPDYSEYYGGGPTGPGFCNLYLYIVTGQACGTSAKTDRPTNRKSVYRVYARGADDALGAALSAGVLPPYADVEQYCPGPSVDQLNYIHGVQIPYPALICAEDIRALLTRFQEQDDERTPAGMFDLSTTLRIQVSYFAPPSIVSAYIWNCIPVDLRPPLFCYAVYCQECGVSLGCANLPYAHPAFSGFTPTAQQQKYLSQLRTLHKLQKGTAAYCAAVCHLRAGGLL